MPFNIHSEDNRTLRAKGLDANAWLTWLTRVVATEDIYLGESFNLQKQDDYIKMTLASFEEMSALDEQKIDLKSLKIKLEKDFILKNRQYQKIVRQLGNLSKDLTPPELWTGIAGNELVRTNL